MKVVLINVPHLVSQIFGIKGRMPQLVQKHLGIGYIAAGLETKGHEVKYLDCSALGINIDQAMDYLQQESPDLIGIPCFVHGRFLVYEMVEKIKRHFPEIPVVVGGPQVTLFPEQIFAECPHVSLVLRGEADFTFAELATRLEEKKKIANIPGKHV